MFFTTFSPAFHPFFHRCSPTFPPWNSPFQARRSRGETSPAQRWFHGCVSGYTTRSRESHAVCSERIRKARNLWCGTFWIGHDWSLKVWMDSIQVVWYEWTLWIDMIYHWKYNIYIYNSKFGPAKGKNEKCKRKKHHNHQNYKCKILVPGKKGNKYQVSLPKFMKHHSKKKQTNVPLESSENPTLMHMFFNRASRLPLALLCRLHGLE